MEQKPEASQVGHESYICWCWQAHLLPGRPHQAAAIGGPQGVRQARKVQHLVRRTQQRMNHWLRHQRDERAWARKQPGGELMPSWAWVIQVLVLIVE